MASDDSPALLQANAWCGAPARGELSDSSLNWAGRRDVPHVPKQFLAAPKVDMDNWADAQVGWGVVAPDRDLDAKDKATGRDLPEPIRRLLAARGNAPIFRYRPELREGRLRRYGNDGVASDPSLRGTRGLGLNAVPRYLLIVGSPAEIPWNFQYRLQTDAFVGRLDLDDSGLSRYVDALIGGWAGAKRSVKHPLVWAVDRGQGDITHLMRMTISEKFRAAFAADEEFEGADCFRSDDKATHAELLKALSNRQPAFVLTSSHGATFPLDDALAMRRQIGLLVDNENAVLNFASAVDAWKPTGAIWYAHACCSAGSDAKSKFEGLVGSESSLGRTLSAIAKTGACTAPLPAALLGGANPLGAFIGHVEPTFDWTLRDPATGQVVTDHIMGALYRELHKAKRPTVGRALSYYFGAVAGLMQDYADAMDEVDAHGIDALKRARRAKLFAMDRLAMVLLGDPTVRLPLPS